MTPQLCGCPMPAPACLPWPWMVPAGELEHLAWVSEPMLPAHLLN